MARVRSQKNMMPLTQKKTKKNEILQVTFFSMLTYFFVFFVSVDFLLMMLLAFHETNKSYISK